MLAVAHCLLHFVPRQLASTKTNTCMQPAYVLCWQAMTTASIHHDMYVLVQVYENTSPPKRYPSMTSLFPYGNRFAINGYTLLWIITNTPLSIK